MKMLSHLFTNKILFKINSNKNRLENLLCVRWKGKDFPRSMRMDEIDQIMKNSVSDNMNKVIHICYIVR